jgi:hypothetical protein
LIIDGEAVACDDNGVTSFNRVRYCHHDESIFLYALPYVCAMSASYCHDSHDDDPQRGNPAYRRVLWIVLAINAVMFAVEISDLIRWRAARPRSR